MNLFAAQLQSTKVELNVMVRTKNDYVFRNVRTVVRAAKRLDVMGLCIGAAVGQGYRVTAQLAKVFVKKLDLSGQLCVSENAINVGVDSAWCFSLRDVAGKRCCR